MKRIVCIEYKNATDFEKASDELIMEGYELHTCSSSIIGSGMGNTTVWNAIFVLSRNIKNNKKSLAHVDTTKANITAYDSFGERINDNEQEVSLDGPFEDGPMLEIFFEDIEMVGNVLKMVNKKNPYKKNLKLSEKMKILIQLLGYEVRYNAYSNTYSITLVD